MNTPNPDSSPSLENKLRKIAIEDAKRGDAYPVTIVRDRYSGVYSGAVWLAFNHRGIPKGVGGDDVAEMEFWSSNPEESYLIGKGDTPQAAFESLLENILRLDQ